MMEVRQIKKLIDRLKVLKGERSNWNNTWQTVAMYVDTKKADFNTTQTDGQFLNTKVFDNTASQYAKSRASTLKSMVSQASPIVKQGMDLVLKVSSTDTLANNC